jgi:hypothetical protein
MPPARSIQQARPAYHACDQDPEHNQARARLIPLTEQIARVQA